MVVVVVVVGVIAATAAAAAAVVVVEVVVVVVVVITAGVVFVVVVVMVVAVLVVVEEVVVMMNMMTEIMSSYIDDDNKIDNDIVLCISTLSCSPFTVHASLLVNCSMRESSITHFSHQMETNYQLYSAITFYSADVIYILRLPGDPNLEQNEEMEIPVDASIQHSVQ